MNKRKNHLKVVSWIILVIFIDVILFSFLPDSNWLEILFSFSTIMIVGALGVTIILKIFD
ncbi:hypothetical protein HMPREF3177_07350 [Nosocomiicoccus sp. HMSC09A07]|nr:hypothetical protein HMPREF2767_05880 [Nosocomiicoccus sp. HMSC067E10]OFO54219.1 hypothetical protein HMPREF3029_00805 [Nosocomiicoccus sp. HMSC059G07]OFS61713.1 hypothetical protein HMPREF3177_07350 [Nosocomiicoccus sp. HMSC09A07]